MKKTAIFIALLIILPLAGLFADESEGESAAGERSGRLFHFRPMVRVDLAGVADYALDSGIGYGQDQYLFVSFTMDFLFYRENGLRLGPRLDLGAGMGRECPSLGTFSLGFHIESEGFYSTIGFQCGYPAGEGVVLGWQNPEVDEGEEDWFLADYNWTSLWVEFGYIMILGGRDSGLTFEIGLSCLPATVYSRADWYEWDEYSYDEEETAAGMEILGPIFLETAHLFVGIGYTF